MTTRKKSYDMYSTTSRNRDFQPSNTLNAGNSRYRNDLMSPRNVIAGARESLAGHNTVTAGMMITGGKKEGWANPNSTAKNALGAREHGLSVQDVVDNMLRKPAFGFEGYNPKATVKDLLPVHTHVRAKSKRNTFVDDSIKAKNKVPCPSKYQSSADWAKDPESRTARFFRSKRNT